jgi:hypothetical protein
MVQDCLKPINQKRVLKKKFFDAKNKKGGGPPLQGALDKVMGVVVPEDRETIFSNGQDPPVQRK